MAGSCISSSPPRHLRTPHQQLSRSNFRAIASRWRALTPEQPTAWCIAAADSYTVSRLGRKVPLNGYNYFMRINAARADIGLSQFDLSPAVRMSRPFALAPLASPSRCYPGSTSVLPPQYLRSTSASHTEVARRSNGGRTGVGRRYQRRERCSRWRGQPIQPATRNTQHGIRNTVSPNVVYFAAGVNRATKPPPSRRSSVSEAVRFKGESKST